MIVTASSSRIKLFIIEKFLSNKIGILKKTIFQPFYLARKPNRNGLFRYNIEMVYVIIFAKIQ